MAQETIIHPPMSLLAELTHRCPLQCPYCSNPLHLLKRNQELSSKTWIDLISQAQSLGVLQIHFSGGEPLTYPQLPQLVEHARACSLYSNLITSGISLHEKKLHQLARKGLDHIQLSMQDVFAGSADHIAHYKGAFEKKRRVIEAIGQTDIPLTLNFVVHRHNCGHVGDMLKFAQQFDIHRVEIAHVQYHGWAFKNRDALLPSKEQIDETVRAVEKARKQHVPFKIDLVTPDYYSDRPKPCMGGWGERFFNITPNGAVLPCHGAQEIKNIDIPSVHHSSLHDIWYHSSLFNQFRGEGWMKEPCRSCDFRHHDHGGCRCQALALTGDPYNTDPVCRYSSHRDIIETLIKNRPLTSPDFYYRNQQNAH